MVFFFKKALKDISDNQLLNGVAIITIALSVLIVSAFGLFFINANELLTSWKKDIRVMAYLSPSADSDSISKTRQMLETMSDINNVTFIDRNDALRAFKQQLKGQSSLLDNLKENPLPDAFEIHLLPDPQATGRLETLVRHIESLDAVDDVEYGQQWMGSVSSVLNLFQFASYAMGGLFFMAAVFIVANTIRLILYSRREEVEIMRLVGATDGFIKAPFYIEGLLQGLAGAIFGLGTLYLTYYLISNNIGQDYFGSGFNVKFFPFGTCCLIVAASMLIGGIGCSLSLKQFLK
jgi:cell division transport system permease protein